MLRIRYFILCFDGKLIKRICILALSAAIRDMLFFQEKTGGVRSSGNQSEFFKDINMRDDANVMNKKKNIPLVSELVS